MEDYPRLNGVPIDIDFVRSFSKRNPPGKSGTKIGNIDNYHAPIIIAWLLQQLDQKDTELQELKQEMGRSWFEIVSDWVNGLIRWKRGRCIFQNARI